MPIIPDDAVWLITGTSTGLGAALCHALLASPSFTSPTSTQILIPTARTLSSLTTHLPSNHPRIHPLILDVTSPTSITSTISLILQKYNHIDVLINNAGINTFCPAELLPDVAAREIFETNFWGTVNMTRAVLPGMRSSGNERTSTILNITSLGGRVGAPAHATYCASKHAVEGWMESLRGEIEDAWGVRLGLVEMGGVRTEYMGKSLRGPGDAGQGWGGLDVEGWYGEESKVGEMMKGLLSEDAQEGWRSAEDVATRIVELLTGDQELPFRMVLGADAYEWLKGVDEGRRQELRNWMDK